jgi:four helix bundle protein
MYSKKKIESFEREARLGFPSLCNRVVEDLRVWQKGIQLVKQVYIITNEGKLSKDFGLKDQLRRASVSIPTNVAEGFERRSRKEYVNFLNIAKGSAGELRSLLRVALEVDYIEQSTYSQLNDQAIELSRMLFNQIQSINRASSV